MAESGKGKLKAKRQMRMKRLTAKKDSACHGSFIICCSASYQRGAGRVKNTEQCFICAVWVHTGEGLQKMAGSLHAES